MYVEDPDEDMDLLYTPFFHEVEPGTEAVGNMRLTPFGREWAEKHP